jgi:outer membrane protein assembly factor BamB
MIGKSIAVLVLAASCLVIGSPPGFASSRAHAPSENAPWSQTDAGAAGDRANLTEHVLTPSAVAGVGYLRSMASPLIPPNDCQGPVVAPVLSGGDVYAVTDEELSKYDAATGSLIWRKIPDRTFDTDFLSVSLAGGLVVVDGLACDSASEPEGELYAYNASTGALVWSAGNEGLYQAVVAGSDVITAGADAAGYFLNVLSLKNGKTIWANDNECPPDGSTSPLVVGALVMTYNCNSKSNPVVQASNLATGAVAWSLPGSWEFQRGDRFSSLGTHLFATAPSGIVEALNPQTGQEEYSLNKAVSVLAVDTARVYATCGSKGEYVCGYNVSSGALEWQNRRLDNSATLAAEADGVLYLDFGQAVNAATGKVITQIWDSFDNSPTTALAVGDGRIAVVSDPRVLDLFGLPGY